MTKPAPTPISNSVETELTIIKTLLVLLLQKFDTLNTTEKAQEKTMKSVAEYVVELTSLTEKIKADTTRQTDLGVAIKTALQGNTAIIAGLKQQIADLIAQGGTVDTTALQPLVDQLAAAEASQVATLDELAAAVIAGTPAAA